jgi:hypothetical protein
MAVDEVKAAAHEEAQHPPGQEDVKSQFVQTGADLVVGPPGGGTATDNFQPGDVPPQIVVAMVT